MLLASGYGNNPNTGSGLGYVKVSLADGRRWNLLAGQNHGPYIPCGAAIALARKLASAMALPAGAMPCIGLLTVKEFLAPLRNLDIREVVQ